ncbi:MAG: hypothetical protein AB1430_10545 [Pseudomonadota bacterium]
MTASPLIALALAACTTLAAAQHAHNPYAGQQQREIKALSAQEVADLLQGKGMGYAKPAELNGYPGPAHVLALADELSLTPHQREATQALMAGHQARARALGAALVEAERALDQAFAQARIEPALLDRLVSEAARGQAALRAEHLQTHLAQAALLQQRQITRYQHLRGYAGAASTPHTH